MSLVVVPEELCRLAAGCGESALGLHRAELLAALSWEVPGHAAGDSVQGPGLAGLHAKAVSAGTEALETLAEVLELDMDRLYRAAFDFSRADEFAAAAAAGLLTRDL